MLHAVGLSRGILIRFAALIALPCLLGILGCGSGFGTISGRVTYKGNPLKGGNITFVGAEGKGGGTARIKENGEYTVSKVPVGLVKICVETKSLAEAATNKSPKYTPPPGMKGPQTGAEDAKEAKKHYVWIPEKFGLVSETPLSYTVTSGSQTHNVNLDGP